MPPEWIWGIGGGLVSAIGTVWLAYTKITGKQAKANEKYQERQEQEIDRLRDAREEDSKEIKGLIKEVTEITAGQAAYRLGIEDLSKQVISEVRHLAREKQ